MPMHSAPHQHMHSAQCRLHTQSARGGEEACGLLPAVARARPSAGARLRSRSGSRRRSHARHAAHDANARTISWRALRAAPCSSLLLRHTAPALSRMRCVLPGPNSPSVLCGSRRRRRRRVLDAAATRCLLSLLLPPPAAYDTAPARFLGSGTSSLASPLSSLAPRTRRWRPPRALQRSLSTQAHRRGAAHLAPRTCP